MTSPTPPHLLYIVDGALSYKVASSLLSNEDAQKSPALTSQGSSGRGTIGEEQAGCLLRDLLELAQERLVVHAQAFALRRGEGLFQQLFSAIL